MNTSSSRPQTPTTRIVRGALLAAGVTLALLAPAGAASARGAGAGWRPVTGLPDGAQVSCGANTVTLTFPENREYVRTLDGDGVTVDHTDQFTGSLSVRYTTADGKAITLSAGGPGTVTYYLNGDVETRSEGWYNFGFPDLAHAAELGVPQIFSTTGLIDFITHPDADQTITPIRVPAHVIDVCAELGFD